MGRFDQREPDPAPKSRFDRRSRSPHNRRSRSPARGVSSPSTAGIKTESANTPNTAQSQSIDASEAQKKALEAAAKINALFKVEHCPKKRARIIGHGINMDLLTSSMERHCGLKPQPVPSVNELVDTFSMTRLQKEKTKAVGPSTQRAAVVAKPLPKKDASGIYSESGDFQKDIEINHLRNRYTLTKGAFQKQIKDETGADVTTKGVYVPDTNTAVTTQPPLYLQVTAQTKEALEKAVQMIDDKMKEDLPNLIDERRFRGRREEPEVERDEFGRRKWPDERIPIPFEPLIGFNLRAQIVGAGGAYVKFIQQQSGCRVQIKGRGSGFIENDTQEESDEQMYLHVSGREKSMVEHGKTLALELLAKVKEEYDRFKANGPSQNMGGMNRGGPGGPRHSSMGGGGQHGPPPPPPPDGPGGYGGGYGSGYNGGYGGGGGYSNAQSPPPPPPSAGPMSPQIPTHSAFNQQQSDYTQQYMQYYAQPQQPGQDPAAAQADPYAAYGGYEAYMQYYAAYYAQAQQAAQAQSPVGGMPVSGGAAPPPPPDNGAQGGYNAVPPPPGM